MVALSVKFTDQSDHITLQHNRCLRAITVLGICRQHFLPEHQHPINQGLHVVGTIGSTVFAAAALISSRPWLALLYPIVFTVPGLLGHRIFERNMDVGDMRITRKDFPPHWFIIGNYLLSYELLLGKGCERTSKAD